MQKDLKDITGVIFDIKRYTLHDGPGIRTTVFMKGCPMRCTWCQNPESCRMLSETVTNELPLDGAVYETEEVIGRRLAAKDLLQEILRDSLFMEQSNGGVTFSGGEPLVQSVFLTAILRLCKMQLIHTAIDTTGYGPAGNLEAVLPYTDLFLYDLKLIDTNEHRQYTGVGNESVIENLKLIARAGKFTYIRVPIVPGITDTEKNLHGIAELLAQLHVAARVDLLPFHKAAEKKYKRLHQEFPAAHIEPPTHERMEEIKSLFESYHLPAIIGGVQ
ncbi:MAG: glycyl-radical enzyme activating protein [Ignavibacteria bacterium]|nr:glycyl-radical enzyme activating protein [Ignavibacteria bacterium]